FSHTQDEDEENWNLEAIADYIEAQLLDEDVVSFQDLARKEREEIIEFIMEKVQERYDEREEELTPERMREFEKVLVLRSVDRKWMDHIDQMDQLRQGIHLRAYGQNDPLREYQIEGFQMFEQMVQAIEEEVTQFIMKAEIKENIEREAVAQNTKAVA